MMILSGLKKKRELAKLIEIPAQSLTRYMARPEENVDPQIPSEWVIKFMQVTDATLDELVGDEKKAEKKAGAMARWKPDVIVPYASKMSEGIKLDIEKVLIECTRKWVEESFGDSRDSLVGWIMDSDNMDPTIKLGAFLVIDTAKKEIKGGGIYAFQINGRILIRRVQEMLDGSLEIMNDNRQYGNAKIPGSAPNDGGITAIGATKLMGRIVMIANSI